MKEMFSQCKKITDLNVSKFNTSNVVTMENMFADCNELYGINLENFDTAKANTNNMFKLSTGQISFIVYAKSDTKLKAYNYEEGSYACIREYYKK